MQCFSNIWLYGENVFFCFNFSSLMILLVYLWRKKTLGFLRIFKKVKFDIILLKHSKKSNRCEGQNQLKVTEIIKVQVHRTFNILNEITSLITTCVSSTNRFLAQQTTRHNYPSHITSIITFNSHHYFTSIKKKQKEKSHSTPKKKTNETI